MTTQQGIFMCKPGFGEFKFLSYIHIGGPEIQSQIDLTHELASLVTMGHMLRNRPSLAAE